MLPVRCRKVIGDQQDIAVLDQRHRIRVLRLVGLDQGIEGRLGIFKGRHLPDAVQRPLGLGLHGLRQRVPHISCLVHPATLLTGLRDTSPRAAQKPRAPSPITSSGALRPQCFSPGNTSRQHCSSRDTVPADNPFASGPTSASSPDCFSPVEIPFKYSYGSPASRLLSHAHVGRNQHRTKRTQLATAAADLRHPHRHRDDFGPDLASRLTAATHHPGAATFILLALQSL